VLISNFWNRVDKLGENMSESVLMWAVGGFLVFCAAMTKVSYTDPKFYISFLEPTLSKVCTYITISAYFLWGGLFISKKYVELKLHLTDEQMKIYNADYDWITNPILLILIFAVLSYLYTSYLILVALKKVSENSLPDK
jgi:hypothetical protein